MLSLKKTAETSVLDASGSLLSSTSRPGFGLLLRHTQDHTGFRHTCIIQQCSDNCSALCSRDALLPHVLNKTNKLALKIMQTVKVNVQSLIVVPETASSAGQTLGDGTGQE